MVLLMGWVFGVRRETFNTTTQFITVIVVTDITNIRYLPEKHTFLKGGQNSTISLPELALMLTLDHKDTDLPQSVHYLTYIAH